MKKINNELTEEMIKLYCFNTLKEVKPLKDGEYILTISKPLTCEKSSIPLITKEEWDELEKSIEKVKGGIK